MGEIWAVLKVVILEHSWMALPISILSPVAIKCPELVKVVLEHRKAMWELKSKEQRRVESVKARQQKNARRPPKKPGSNND
jgi:heme exporter protein D